MNIDIKLKSYEELQFEIIRLNNDNYLKQITINKQKEVLDKIKEELNDLYNADQSERNYKIFIEKIDKLLGAIIWKN